MGSQVGGTHVDRDLLLGPRPAGIEIGQAAALQRGDRELDRVKGDRSANRALLEAGQTRAHQLAGGQDFDVGELGTGADPLAAQGVVGLNCDQALAVAEGCAVGDRVNKVAAGVAADHHQATLQGIADAVKVGIVTCRIARQARQVLFDLPGNAVTVEGVHGVELQRQA